jgi:metal-sulfur cluster biosynthetic enzyme
MCPFADFIIASIQEAAVDNTGATDVEIDLTFDPPFTIEMVPEDTRLAMGWV